MENASLLKKSYICLVIVIAFSLAYNLNSSSKSCSSLDSENFKKYTIFIEEWKRVCRFWNEEPSKQYRADATYEDVLKTFNDLTDFEKECYPLPTPYTILPPSKEKIFQRALESYYSTLRSVAGTGFRGQSYIDNAYEKMEKAYLELSDLEKDNWSLPEKAKSFDDGYYGASYGMANIK
jgi:hypothetical protein